MFEALQFEFMQNALLAGLLASVICGIMGTLVVVNRIVFLSGGIADAAFGGILLCFALSACTPTVEVQAPKEPITINLNVKLDAEVRVKIEEQATKDIQSNPDIF